MGIENTRRRPRRGTWWAPHYPSWGLETPRIGPPGGPTRPRSLPLMGIGNLPGGRRPATAVPTPHYPSWGLETAAGRASPAPGASAHYPSWGLETRHGAVPVGAGSTASLPLMGIGNRRSASPRPCRRPPHYPSWGLETRARPATTPRRRSPHYPSWGLETLAALMSHAALHRHSLPLMGIGNRVGRAAVDEQPDGLITPHGDWKRGRETDDDDCELPPHYPSWGLETRPRGTTTCTTTSPHYPSWGLET